MEFRLLGPSEVTRQDRLLELGALKQRALLAVLLLNANDVVSVERLVDELWSESPPAGGRRLAGLPVDEEWLVSMSLLAETALRVGDGERADTIQRLLLPYADRVAVSLPEIALGSVARHLGLAAIAAGRPEEAEAHLLQAIELDDRIGARRAAARSRADLQRLLRSRPRGATRSHP